MLREATVAVAAVAISVSPPAVSMSQGATQQFIATVTGAFNTTVTWSATGGTISSSGVYAAPATAGTFRVISYLSAFFRGDQTTV